MNLAPKRSSAATVALASMCGRTSLEISSVTRTLCTRSERHARDATLLHTGHEHRVTLLQASDALEHHVLQHAARAQRSAGEPEHADQEHRDADEHERADTDFLLVREVH